MSSISCLSSDTIFPSTNHGCNPGCTDPWAAPGDSRSPPGVSRFTLRAAMPQARWRKAGRRRDTNCSWLGCGSLGNRRRTASWPRTIAIYPQNSEWSELRSKINMGHVGGWNDVKPPQNVGFRKKCWILKDEPKRIINTRLNQTEIVWKPCSYVVHEGKTNRNKVQKVDDQETLAISWFN